MSKSWSLQANKFINVYKNYSPTTCGTLVESFDMSKITIVEENKLAFALESSMDISVEYRHEIRAGVLRAVKKEEEMIFVMWSVSS